MEDDSVSIRSLWPVQTRQWQKTLAFLPGTEEEKMGAFGFGRFDDNLEILHGADEHTFQQYDYVKQKANIHFKIVEFNARTSFNNALIIIDELKV